MDSLSIDEIIIDFVRENHCLYDKRNVDFKNNNKKKNVWQKISNNLKTLYEIDMTAEIIERRWWSLRDMFSREDRRQKLPPSGSGYEPTTEWELYRNMLFLKPHIAHRRTKTSFLVNKQVQSSLLERNRTDTSVQKQLQTLLPEINTTNIISSVPLKSEQSFIEQSSNLIVPPLLCDESSDESFTSIEANRPSLNMKSEETNMKIDSAVLNRSSILSKCSNTTDVQLSQPSTSFNSKYSKIPPTHKSIKKVVPEMDEFAKRRKRNYDSVDHNLAETSKEISAAVKTISSQLCDEKRHNNSYMLVIEEGIKYIPSRNMTQCVIELLEIIKKYEERQ